MARKPRLGSCSVHHTRPCLKCALMRHCQAGVRGPWAGCVCSCTRIMHGCALVVFWPFCHLHQCWRDSTSCKQAGVRSCAQANIYLPRCAIRSSAVKRCFALACGQGHPAARGCCIVLACVLSSSAVMVHARLPLWQHVMPSTVLSVVIVSCHTV